MPLCQLFTLQFLDPGREVHRRPLELLSSWMEDLCCNICYWHTQTLWNTSFAVLGHIADYVCMCICMGVYVSVYLCMCMYVSVYGVCVCIYMGLCVSKCLCMCVFVHVEDKGHLSLSFLRCCPSYFLRGGLQLAWNSLIGHGWLASELQGTTRLCLLSAGMISVCLRTSFVFRMGSVNQTQVSMFGWLSHLPSPLCASWAVSWAPQSRGLWEKLSPGSLM